MVVKYCVRCEHDPQPGCTGPQAQVDVVVGHRKVLLIEPAQALPVGPGDAKAGARDGGHIVGHREAPEVARVVTTAVLVAVAHQATHAGVYAGMLDGAVGKK